MDIIISILLGLAIGSFLNVVIYRLPKILIHTEKQWARSVLEKKPILQSTLNLSHPRSHCPHCKHSIAWYHNLPVISWLFLKGKCAHCPEKISVLYPFVEITAALTSVLLLYRFGMSEQWLFWSMLFWGLLALSLIDYQNLLLPDELTLPLLWMGLSFHAFWNTFVHYQTALLGALLGYMVLWVSNALFKIIRKKEGIGAGDFKLLALIGAWLGYEALPSVLFVASVLGLLFCLMLWMKDKTRSIRNTPIPFGLFLSIAATVHFFQIIRIV